MWYAHTFTYYLSRCESVCVLLNEPTHTPWRLCHSVTTTGAEGRLLSAVETIGYSRFSVSEREGSLGVSYHLTGLHHDTHATCKDLKNVYANTYGLSSTPQRRTCVKTSPDEGLKPSWLSHLLFWIWDVKLWCRCVLLFSFSSLSRRPTGSTLSSVFQ